MMRWIGFLAGLMVGLHAGTPVFAQTVKAYVDRNPIMSDETVQLIVETDQPSSGTSPDWQVLDAQFDVLGTTHSQQTSIINMQRQSRIQWIATLAPKTTGTLTIPPLYVGAHHSDPIQLTVKPVDRTGTRADTREIFLEADVDSRTPYPQGQVLLTLRLSSAVPVQEGRLDEPEIEWGIVERVGKDASYEVTRNGKRYQVTERRYAITPQTSGTHEIPPVLFTGKIQDRRTRSTLFDELFGHTPGGLGRDPFQTARTVHRRSPEITLTVKELPQDLNGRFWLPAQDLTLSETWSSDPAQLQMGESLTRTVTIRAKGLRGEQLPELNMPAQDILKVYPDKADIQTDFDGTWIHGIREAQYVMVPTQPGTAQLPPIRVPWWNMETERWEEARLPGKTLTILGTPQAGKPESTHPVAPVPPDIPFSDGQDASPDVSPNVGASPHSEETLPWFWIAVGCAGLWLATLAAWWLDRRKKTGGPGTGVIGDQQILLSERQAVQAVKAACRESSTAHARDALLQWASIKQGHPCRSLGDVAHALRESTPDGAELTKAIWDLDRRLYAASADRQVWDGGRFWEIVKPALTAKPPKPVKQDAELPPLYLHRS